MNPQDLARMAIEKYLTDQTVLSVPEELSALFKQRAGCFVSLHENGQLRGCIGTILPVRENLASEIIDNAISAATEDNRFLPVDLSEVHNLEISVDVLSQPMFVKNQAELDPKRFGAIVRTREGRCGVLLPDIPGVDNTAEQIAICRQKGGIMPDEEVQIEKFEVERFSSKLANKLVG